ncbi:MAG: 5-formyltetrahydrofolate cyclo-ligase [Betaproteobacteria bacterium]|nr:5-formyltetrahydrofolate cyclo-ligase [Betaproteobacteria bacterium]
MPTDTQDEQLVARKRALRSAVLARRDALSAEERACASALLAGKVLGSPAYQAARSVLVYLSFGSEVDTHAIFEAVLRDGKTAVLPRVDALERKLCLHRVTGMDDLAAGVWGIREPHPHLPVTNIADIDFVLVPGVAFDRIGNRLGYGAGYYDRLLAGAPATLARVAAAFDCQRVDDLPVGPYDQRVDILYTEKGEWQKA